MARGRPSPMGSPKEAMRALAARKKAVAEGPRMLDLDRPYAVSISQDGRREYFQDGLFYSMAMELLDPQPDRAPPEQGTPGIVTIGNAGA